MTQSKKTDFESSINIDELDLGDLISDDTITINLNNTYGSTTTYWSGDSVTDITIGSGDGTFTIDTNTIDWTYDIVRDKKLDPEEVERMCKEYPALEKVWRNFKSVYDMVKQDYEGKKKSGEIDDDIPF